MLFQLSYIPTGSTVAEGAGPVEDSTRVESGTPSNDSPARRSAERLVPGLPFADALRTADRPAAALAWGSLDVITALGSRVVGSLRVTAGMQL